MRNRKGFTLVELIIVIGLLALIATIAGLNLRNYTLNRNLRTAARNIVADFNLCKARAVSESISYQVIFNIAGGNYTIQQLNNAATAVTKRPLPLSEGGSDISINSANFVNPLPQPQNEVNFGARGTVSSGNVVLRNNSRNSVVTITVNTMGRTYVDFSGIK
jgi:prepilin-type N-terminal cleavage/methylation domain-containing protein